jgi:hypothetical protein
MGMDKKKASSNWLDFAIITWLWITNDGVLEPKKIYKLMEL